MVDIFFSYPGAIGRIWYQSRPVGADDSHSNSQRVVGSPEMGDTSFKLCTGSFLRTAKNIENLMTGVFDGSPTYVRDVAAGWFMSDAAIPRSR